MTGERIIDPEVGRPAHNRSEVEPPARAGVGDMLEDFLAAAVEDEFAEAFEEVEIDPLVGLDDANEVDAILLLVRQPASQ